MSKKKAPMRFSKEAPEIAEAFVESLPEENDFVKPQTEDYELASHIATVVDVDDVSVLARRLAGHRIEVSASVKARGLKRSKQDELDSMGRAIIAAVDEAGTNGASKKQVLEKVNATESQWNRLIKKLIDKDMLVRFGKKKGAKYFTPQAFEERYVGTTE